MNDIARLVDAKDRVPFVYSLSIHVDGDQTPRSDVIKQHTKWVQQEVVLR